MLFRTTLCLAISALTLPVVALTASPAAAEGDLFVEDAVLFDGCHSHGLDYILYYPGAYEWEVDGTIYTPGGDYSGGWTDNGTGDAAYGHDSWQICSHEGNGWWDADATVTWYDSSYNVVAIENLNADFRVPRQPTRTKLEINDKTPRYGQVVRLKVISEDLQPRGWTANSYAQVAIKAKCDGQPWHRVRGSKQYTNQRGRVSGKWRWNIARKCRVRAVTFRDDNAAKSYSRDKIWATQRAAGRVASRPRSSEPGFGG